MIAWTHRALFGAAALLALLGTGAKAQDVVTASLDYLAPSGPEDGSIAPLNDYTLLASIDKALRSECKNKYDGQIVFNGHRSSPARGTTNLHFHVRVKREQGKLYYMMVSGTESEPRTFTGYDFGLLDEPISEKIIREIKLLCRGS